MLNKKALLLLIVLGLPILGMGIEEASESLFEEEVDFVPKSVSNEDIEVIVKLVEPDEIGVGEVRIDNVDVKILGTEVVFQETTDSDLIKQNIKKLKSQAGYETLIDSLKGITSKTMDGLTLTSSLQVYEVTTIYANVEKRAYRTKKNIRFEPSKDFKEIKIIEIIPPSINVSFSSLFFLDKRPSMLQKTPLVLQWNFKNVKKGDSVNLSYFMKLLVVGDEGNSLFGVGSPLKTNIKGENKNQITGLIGDFGFSIESAEILLERANTASFLLIISFIGVAVLIGGILISELENKNGFEELKNIYRNIEGYVRLGITNKKLVDKYIVDCLGKGHLLEDIRKYLLRAGWDRKAVRRLLEKYKNRLRRK